MRLGKIYQTKILDLDSAIICYEKIIETDNTNFKAFYQLGLTYAEKKDPKKALEYLKESLKLNTKFSPSFKAIGNILYESGNNKNAIKYYEKALEFDPSDFETKLGLANCYFSEEKFDSRLWKIRLNVLFAN